MKLLKCYLPVFKFIMQSISEKNSLVEYDAFRLSCISYLEEAVLKAEGENFSDNDRDEALFATVVWIDEAILTSSLPYRELWRVNPLQRKYFSTSVGGDEFFYKLSKLTEGNNESRCVYLFCLLQGYHGKYENTNLSELQKIILEIRSKTLPDNWRLWPCDAIITPLQPVVRAKKHKIWPVVGVGAGCVFFFYALLFFIQYYFFV